MKLLTHEEFDDEIRKAIEPPKEAKGRDILNNILSRIRGREQQET